MRFERITEVWAALSIGLLLIGFVLLIVFSPGRAISAGIGLVVLFLLLEAFLRGRFSDAVRSIATVLALVMAVILAWTYLWQLVVAALLAGGVYLTYLNVRALFVERNEE